MAPSLPERKKGTTQHAKTAADEDLIKFWSLALLGII